MYIDILSSAKLWEVKCNFLNSKSKKYVINNKLIKITIDSNAFVYFIKINGSF